MCAMRAYSVEDLGISQSCGQQQESEVENHTLHFLQLSATRQIFVHTVIITFYDIAPNIEMNNSFKKN